MINLAKVGYSRASSGSRSGALRRNGQSLLSSRYPTVAGSASRPPSVQLFSMARPPPTSRKLFSKKAPFSAVMMGQQAEQGAVRQWPLCGKVMSADVREIVRGFREAMVKNRLPLRFLGLNTKTNISNLCGHASFVILALAYLETDVLMLRGYAASGIGLSILFQFYRSQPLWIPIGWNGVFMAINVSMIGLLLKEKNDAEKLGEDPEQAGIFEEVFVPVELTPVDFVRLMDLAERRVVPKGHHLSVAGKLQEEVYLIVEGTAEVASEGVAVCHLEPAQFVGSMAFSRFISNVNVKPETAPSPPAGSAMPPPQNTASAAAAADVDVPSNPEGRKAGPVATSALSTEVGVNGDENKSGDVDEDDDGQPEYIDDMYIPGGAGVFEEAREAALGLLRQDSFVGEVAKSFVAESGGGKGACGLESSLTSVTASSDVVVFAWDMHLLRAFIKRHPLAGASFQNAISADLTRKVDQSRGHEERYRLLLAEALDGGEITPIEKKKLHRYRDMHGISLSEHKEIVAELEWKDEEYEAGFQKGVAPRDGSKDFLKYEALVRRELAKGEVEDEGKSQLRQFRTLAGIDAQEHLLALEKQGWTADDYEVGGKGKAEHFDDQNSPEQPDVSNKPAKRQRDQAQQESVGKINASSDSGNGGGSGSSLPPKTRASQPTVATATAAAAKAATAAAKAAPRMSNQAAHAQRAI